MCECVCVVRVCVCMCECVCFCSIACIFVTVCGTVQYSIIIYSIATLVLVFTHMNIALQNSKAMWQYHVLSVVRSPSTPCAGERFVKKMLIFKQVIRYSMC